MSMLLIVSTGCGKSGNGGSSSGKKSGKTATLADMNEIPEDGIITKEQFKTVAGDNKKVQFKGTTDDGITYIWTYDCSKIQNPADQNLKIDFSEKGLDDLKKWFLSVALYPFWQQSLLPSPYQTNPSVMQMYPFSWKNPLLPVLLPQHRSSLQAFQPVPLQDKQNSTATLPEAVPLNLVHRTAK